MKVNTDQLKFEQGKLYKILLEPLISEKATLITEKNNQYAFKVMKDATKPEIKKAVEVIFEVPVDEVRVCNVKGKKKRFKQVEGVRKSWKKAYVTVKQGHSIDFASKE